MSSNAKIDTTTLSAVETYLLIQKGVLKRFPAGFLDKYNCREIVRWLCLDHYKMNREEICHIPQKFFSDNSISSFKKIFNNLPEMICFSFPEMNIKEWETSRVPDGFWNEKQNQKEFIEWIAEKEKLDLNDMTDVSKITADVIGRYGGSKARRIVGGTYELISSATGNKFQEWEILKMDIWTEKKAICAIKWLIEERLKWSDEQIEESLTAAVFRRNNLGGMLRRYCNNNPVKALEIAYPGKFTYCKSCNM